MVLEHKQKILEEYCNLEKEITKHITSADDPNTIVCCNCGFILKRNKE